jgi:PAS domain S-box-containing protein
LYNEKGIMAIFKGGGLDESLKEKRSGLGDAAGTKNERRDRDSLLGLRGAAMIYNWCNDRDRTAQFISEGSLEVTGYPPETLTNPAGTSYGELIEPEDRDRIWEEIQSALEAGREFRIVYRIRTAGGTTKWVWEQGRGIYSPNGEALFLRGIVLDVSNQVEAEKFLRLQRDLALQLSGSTEVHQIVESSLKYILELTGLDSGGIYLIDEKSGAADLAYSDGVSEEFRQAVSHYDPGSPYASLMREGQPIYASCEEPPVPTLRPDIGEGLKAFCLVPVKAQGQVIGAVIASSHSIFHISSQARNTMEILAGQIGQALLRARLAAEMEERAEQLRDFLDVAAHELRHPATLLKGYAFTLNKRWEMMDAGTRGEALNALDAGVNRLEGVVEELLDMSRIQRGRFIVLKENVEIKPLIERAVREMKDKGNDNAIGIKMKRGKSCAEVDSDAFMRLLIILLDNAVKYSSENSPVEIIAQVHGQDLEVSVLDRGVGIPEEARDKVFDRFYQVEDALHRGVSGLGLGLFIASRIAEAHGGRLEYEPRKGGGSIFTFTL